jgi:hypothetical protein
MRTEEYIRLFGSPEGKRLLQKALTTGAISGGPLVAENLETVITNQLIRLVPELSLPEYKYDPQTVHSYNTITALPVAGSAMGEGSQTPTYQSAMARQTAALMVMKRKGSVTGYLRAAAKKNYDAVEVEIENHLQSFGFDFASYLLYGSHGADQYAFNGLDTYIATNRIQCAVGGVVPTNFSYLDALIDASNRRKAQQHRRAFIMSPEILTKFNQMYTSVRDNRDASRGIDAVEIDGGWRIQTYRHIPILESSQTRPQGQMTAVVATHSGGGGTIPNATRYFQVAPVTWDGEQIASPETSDTTSSSDVQTLTFNTYPNALFYKIYESETTGIETLKKIVSAFTYNGNGTILTGAVPGVPFTVTWTGVNPTTRDVLSTTTAQATDTPFNYTASIPPETIFLWDLDPYQGMGKVAYTNEDGNRLDGLATIIPLAKTDDTDDFLVKAYATLVGTFEPTCGMIRGLRVA